MKSRLSCGSGRTVRSSWKRLERTVRPDPHDNLDFTARNAAEVFAYRESAPVLVADETNGDYFIGIYGAQTLEPHDSLRARDPATGLERWVSHYAYREQVADWWAWAAEHALAEALIWAPIKGESKTFRAAKNAENKNKAIIRRYDLLLRAAKIRANAEMPELTPELIEARDASRRAHEALEQAS